MSSKKHEYTYVGTIRFSFGSETRTKEVLLRGTAKRWYDERGRYWPKESSDRWVSYRRTTYSNAVELDLESVRPLTVEEMRAPLAEEVRVMERSVANARETLNVHRATLRDAVEALYEFDRKHWKDSVNNEG